MVDKNSASAAEIVSGSMQDLKRATIIGQRTFGKGLVQNVLPIAYDGHLKVTTSKYYLPSGRCIQAIDYSEMQKGNKLKKDTAGGIMPDIEINDSAKVDVTYALYTKHMFFDYSVQYRRLHDSIAKPDEFELSDTDIEVSAVMVEPSSGGILALVGGRNYALSQYNRAISSKRQIGSVMKPILYYAALENGFTDYGAVLLPERTNSLLAAF